MAHVEDTENTENMENNYVMPWDFAEFNCIHMRAGINMGLRPLEHVLSGCLLGDEFQDEKHKLSGQCRACFRTFLHMHSLRKHIRYRCPSRYMCSICLNMSKYLVPCMGSFIETCNECMRSSSPFQFLKLCTFFVNNFI